MSNLVSGSLWIAETASMSRELEKYPENKMHLYKPFKPPKDLQKNSKDD